MYTPFDLHGRRILVTGGNGGIGYGMAQALLQAGATVAIWGSNPDKTQAARDALARETEAGDRVHAFSCDVGDEAAVDATFARTATALGGIDTCFANAGVSGKGVPLVDMTLDEWRRIQRINVEGVFLTFRSAARHMIAHGGGGSLVATSSTASIDGAARNSHYGASKGAVSSLVRALAVELSRHKIRVNTVVPGWIATDMTAGSFANEKFAANVLPRVPIRRWGAKEDFGGIAVFLASEASAYITGEQFVIDGGYTKY